jgi:hypothetical protein
MGPRQHVGPKVHRLAAWEARPRIMIAVSGPFKAEAQKAYALAIAEGWRGKGPAVYAELVSHGKDPWLFQSSIAAAHGCVVRTVQRWLRRLRDEGLLQCFRAKKNEIPKGREHPVSCGWSHRVLTVWHTIGPRFAELREQLRQKRAEKQAARNAGRRRYTADEIDRELAKRYGGKPEPDPPPD